MLCLSDSRRDDDPCVQGLLCTLEEAHTLPQLMLAAWALACGLARHLIASVLAERARRPTSWPCCPQCGAGMRRKGLVKRRVISLLGPLRWQRRVGRCPQGGERPQVTPLDDALGVHPQQRTSSAFQHLGWALAVFVLFATTVTLLGWASGVAVEPASGVGVGPGGWTAGDGAAPPGFKLEHVRAYIRDREDADGAGRFSPLNTNRPPIRRSHASSHRLCRGG